MSHVRTDPHCAKHRPPRGWLSTWRFDRHRGIICRPCENDVVALARALFDVGLTSVGPDDLDNRQIASRLLGGGRVRVLR